MDKKIRLTKSLLVRGFQCPKHFYLHINSPIKDDSNEVLKEGGIEVGEKARLLYPNGKLVTAIWPDQALAATEKQLPENDVLFEAAFAYEDLFFRADVFQKVDGGYTITEVKASTEVKEYHVLDAAIQAYIFQKTSKILKKVSILYLNKDYTNDLPLSSLFIEQDITSEVQSLLFAVEKKIEELRTAISSRPNCDIGPHCYKNSSNQDDCPYKDQCFEEKSIPKTSVLNIPNLPSKWKLYQSGKVRLDQLSESDFSTPRQKSYFRKISSPTPTIDLEKIKVILNQWKYPLYFLDFETISNAAPIFPNTKPYKEVPFQFSCFSLQKDSTTPKNECSYLADNIVEDPRIKLAEQLVKALGTEGSIVCYNAVFESTAIKNMMEAVPSLKEELSKLLTRIVDLYPVMKDHVYYPDFNCSWSIKSIIPAIFGNSESYSNMSVKDGLEARALFLEAIQNKAVDQVKKDLVAYCDKDTLEMVRIFLFLIGLKSS